MVVELLDAIAARQDWMGKNVVVLSSQDAGQVRDRLATRLSPEARELAITVYHGVRTSEAELFSCHVEQASHILIVGEDGEDVIIVVGDGVLSVESDDPSVATAVIETVEDVTTVTVTPIAEGSATVTVTMADSANYNGDTAEIAVTVAEAE